MNEKVIGDDQHATIWVRHDGNMGRESEDREEMKEGKRVKKRSERENTET